MFSNGIFLATGVLTCLMHGLVVSGLSIDGASGTIYYDLEMQCKDGSDAGTAATGMNGGTSACGYSPQSLGTSRMVAIDGSIFDKSMCGLEVIIYQNGQPFTFSEGPIFVGELCGGCDQGKKVDLSGKIAMEMMGGECDNPPLFSYQITQNMVGTPLDGTSLPAGDSSPPPVESSAAQVPASSLIVPPVNSQSTPQSIPAGTAPANTVVPTANTAVPPPVNSVAAPVNPATSPSNPPSQPVQPPVNSTSNPAAPSVPSVPQQPPSVPPPVPTTVATTKYGGGKGGWGGWQTPGALFAEKQSTSDGASCHRRRKRRRSKNAH